MIRLAAPLAMLAFAGNSLLCRIALTRTAIDPAAFTLVRLAAGALVLAALVAATRRGPRARDGDDDRPRGNALSGLALFAYAVLFSFAYVRLPAGTGALLLFGAVQATMIGAGLRAGERMGAVPIVGFLLALAGLVALVLPGVGAPAPAAAALMAGAGVAWGIYSLRGRGSADPLGETAGNFARAVPWAVLVAGAALVIGTLRLDAAGAALAATSGALASGVGYALWYAALRRMPATRAAVLQLSVPVLAALGGVVLLAEPLTLRLVVASAVVLGGVALAIGSPRRALN